MQSPSLDLYLGLIEKKLASVTGDPDMSPGIRDMYSYALGGAGKRLRPLLCLEFCRLYGGRVEDALDFAAAIEMVHNYSLVHDDLPCMDDDDIRRGKPSMHRRFGEANALLAGDGLLTDAFGLVSRARSDGCVSADAAVRACAELSDAAGGKGMVLGQFMDLDPEEAGSDPDWLRLTDELKTSRLIRAACRMGALASGRFDDAELPGSIDDFAYEFGVAFQIADDIDDAQEGSSDDRDEKTTVVSLLGADGAKKSLADHTSKALDALSQFGDDAAFLRNFVLRILS